MNPVALNRSWSLATLVAGIYLFLYLPLGVLVFQSFNQAPHGQKWMGFTLDWYLKLARNPDVIAALKNTLWLAVISTAIATVLGTLLGYALGRRKFAGRGAVELMVQLPICVPDIVLAVALLLFFGIARTWVSALELGLPAMIAGHVTFQVPFVALVVKARSIGIDEQVAEAAFDLGASRWQRFWHVTLPMLRPGIISGALLAFTLSLDDFVVSFFMAGAGSTTLPILIYSSVKRGITPEMSALSTLLILAAVIGTCAMMWLRKNDDANGSPIPGGH